jgi:hypothetical protein
MRNVAARVSTAVATAAAIALAGFSTFGNSTAGASGEESHTGPSTLPALRFVGTPPSGAKGPDDVTSLAVEGVDHGNPVVWTAFQNGINPDGTPGSPGGPVQSTVAGYDGQTGGLVESIPVSGKVDGLTADRAHRQLIATVNEDANSALNIIDPESVTVTTYDYSPSPEVNGNGGTDSIAILHGHIYLAHSNPNDTTQATDYEVDLDSHTHTAQLRPVFFDNSTATDAVTGGSVQLALTDPDTNLAMPAASPRFAGTLATISQADGQIVFADSHGDKPELSVLNVTDNVAGNVPPLDGLAVATAGSGTLYVVNSSGQPIQALDTTGWPAGTVFVTEASDNKNPLLGTLDLATGKISPLGNTFSSPKGLVFLPANSHDGDNGEGE